MKLLDPFPLSFCSKIQVQQLTVMRQTLIFPFFSNPVPPLFQMISNMNEIEFSENLKNKSEESFGFGKTRMIH